MDLHFRDEIRTSNARLENFETETLIARLQQEQQQEEEQEVNSVKKTKINLDEKKEDHQVIKSAFTIKVREDDEVAQKLRMSLNGTVKNVINNNSLKSQKKNLFGIVPKKK